MKTKTQPIKNSMNCSPLRRAFVLIVLTGFALSQAAQAQLPSPTPDGGYPAGNTAEGTAALQNLTTGIFNTALGNGALFSNTMGFENVATGAGALLKNTTGFHNTATGIAALFNTTIGNHDTANGDFALVSNTEGNFNTADGAHALVTNTIGNLNIALGFSAGESLTTGSNNIDIANGGVAAESNTIRIGNQVAFSDLEGVMHSAHAKTFIAGIFGTMITGSQVGVTSDGQLGVLATSSQRFKDDINPMDRASEAILALKPVTFRYKKELDPNRVPQFGLVAEEVEKVNPDLVTRDAKGKLYTVRYEAVNAMLLNEFLKEHRTVQGQQKEIDALKAELKEQKALIQKVSAQIEVTKPGPQVVNNDQ
jgi:trimeric autotransporter adhesin